MNIYCIGRNYSEHAKELNNAIPSEPVIFMKPSTALWLGAGAYPIPAFTSSLHYETELVIHIAQQASKISPHQAATIYDKLTLGIDFTARDLQDQLKQKSLPWEKSKAFDNSAFIAPWMPRTEFEDEKNIRFSLIKNEQTVQQGNTANMLFDIPTILSHLSHYFTLYPGDALFTGTPAGVGQLQSGDRLQGYLQSQKMFDFVVQ